MARDAISSIDRRMSRLASLFGGFREPSATLVIVSLAVVLTAVAALAIGIDEELVGSPRGRELLRFGRSDDDLEVTSLALGLRGRSPDVPVVLILGASETREMVDAQGLERSLHEALDPRAEVLILAQPRQAFDEAARIIEFIPDGTPGVCVLNVTFGRFSRPPGDFRELAWPRLGFRSERREEELRTLGAAVPDRTGIFLLDNLRFYFPRLIAIPRNLVLGTPERVTHRYDHRPPRGELGAEFIEERISEFRDRLADFNAHFDANAAKLDAIVEELRRRTRMKVLVTGLPHAPGDVQRRMGEDTYRSMTGRIAERVMEKGLPWIDLAGASLTDRDYWDGLHISSPAARARITELMWGGIKPLLPTRAGTP